MSKTLVLILSGLSIHAFAAGTDDPMYNMPDPVTATMTTDAAMVKMETAVKQETLAAFKKANPALFWLFGEDRQLAVRNNTIPAHWFKNGAMHHSRFAGVARPGEFYVFQVAVVCGPEQLFSSSLDATIKLKGAEVRLISKPRAWGNSYAFAPDKVKPLWIGIQIPTTAKPGTYRGSVKISAAKENIHAPSRGRGNTDILKAVCEFRLEVEGDPIPEGGTGVGEAWRLARLKWLDSEIASSDTEVTDPFTPIKSSRRRRTIDILGRRITLGKNGIPAQYTSYFSGSNTKILKTGRDAFSETPRLECVTNGKILEWEPKSFKFIRQTPVGVSWEATSVSGDLTLKVSGGMEYDGYLQLRMRILSKEKNTACEDIRFVVPWKKDVVKYAMGMGLQGGVCPDKHEWKWDVSKHQDAIWIGDANIGAMMRFKGANFNRPLINAYYDFQPLQLPESWGTGGVVVEKKDGAVTLLANSGPKELQTGREKPARYGFASFNIDWYFTPFRPLDVQKHFTDRYYHAYQRGMEDLKALKAAGVNVVNIHHNHPCNPYINYPFNDDSIDVLVNYIKEAHTLGIRVKVYYTTRELTQNLPEFFALRSLDGEVILPREEGVAWPVTNRGGPHPWLQEHVGMDIVPAWRENIRFPGCKKLDLAMITTPYSRWNNFYIEGLDFLVKKAGIDGLYIDDTALDRKSMQRARRILDADGNTERRIDMHSWNHYNGLAKWANSSIAFMELYPYYDRLWHGEGFNSNMNPEYWLVEMSGIPYGLMSEMLQHGGNPWRGMVFGMTQRWPWSGDPRNVWAVMDQFGITDSDFIGWWDDACPVKTGNPAIKASVYRKEGKTLISMASWSPKREKVKLDIDWKALGLDPKKATLWAPEIPRFQSEVVFAADSAIRTNPGNGWLLIVDETPREISPAGMLNPDPLKGLTVKWEDKTPFEINIPANTVKTKDIPWQEGVTTAVAHLDPMKDEGQSWGVGLAVGWANGKYLQINCRIEGRWGLRINGQEGLVAGHPKGMAATVAIKLDDKTVQLLAKTDTKDADWEVIATYPRKQFPGTPATVRIGKIGMSWSPKDFGSKGPTSPCRVDWIKLF